MKLLLLPLIAFIVSIPGSSSLSCIPCGSVPCQDPVCCDSGYLATDACGCCAVCAQPEGGDCGGPFGTTGSCSQGTRCLRSCETRCNTVSGAECVFPFTYKGKTYRKCTTDNSENNAPWCATQVTPGGEVVNRKWEDCEEFCSSDFCDEGLFNEIGSCVNGSDAQGLLRSLKSDNVAAKLDDDFSAGQKTITTCPTVRSPSDLPDFCRCSNGPITRDLEGNLKGGCIPDPYAETGIEELENGYCFLENVQDPSNPANNCFDDTTWSESDGRFYSHAACQPSSDGSELVFEA